MENNNFKDSIKVSSPTLSNHTTKEDISSTKALYLYVDSALQEILSFLRSFYQKNPEIFPKIPLFFSGEICYTGSKR